MEHILGVGIILIALWGVMLLFNWLDNKYKGGGGDSVC